MATKPALTKTGECYWRDEAGLWLAESFVDADGKVITQDTLTPNANAIAAIGDSPTSDPARIAAAPSSGLLRYAAGISSEDASALAMRCAPTNATSLENGLVIGELFAATWPVWLVFAVGLGSLAWRTWA